MAHLIPRFIEKEYNNLLTIALAGGLTDEDLNYIGVHAPHQRRLLKAESGLKSARHQQ